MNDNPINHARRPQYQPTGALRLPDHGHADLAAYHNNTPHRQSPHYRTLPAAKGDDSVAPTIKALSTQTPCFRAWRSHLLPCSQSLLQDRT
ncbi:MAG: hypothetical protein NTV86_19360 [Planctomycetota bacterium]|nr:hypothetical protein [Planctomycetota bacterium]